MNILDINFMNRIVIIILLNILNQFEEFSMVAYIRPKKRSHVRINYPHMNAKMAQKLSYRISLTFYTFRIASMLCVSVYARPNYSSG